MKRLLFIILLFGVCLHVNQAHAQRCLPGMRGIQLTGGLSDNMRWKNGNGFGYHAGIAVPPVRRKESGLLARKGRKFRVHNAMSFVLVVCAGVFSLLSELWV